MERRHAERLVEALVISTLEADREGCSMDDYEAHLAAKQAVIDALSAVPVLSAPIGEEARHYYFSPMRPLWLGFGSAIGNRCYQYCAAADGRHFTVVGDPLPQETVDSLELIHEGSTRSAG